MAFLRRGAALLLAVPFFSTAFAQTIALDKEDATVWAREQVVTGQVSGATAGVLYADGTPTPFSVVDGAFAVPVVLGEGETAIVACVADGAVCTEVLRLTLGYEPRPEAELRASVEGTTVLLQGTVLENPTGEALSFAWTLDPGNPAALSLAVAGDDQATLALSADAPPGEYYVDWTVQAGQGTPRRARTFVTVHPDGSATAFEIEHDRAAWIDRAVVYEITPRYFANQYLGRFSHVTDKLPEIAALGVNTLWLQPVYPTANGGQAYDVLDYFGIWDALGTEDDLHTLIATAKGLGMRVLFDFVPNHTSVEHPYAQDAAEYGPRSHYYDFYQRTFDDAPYAENYNYLHVGQMTFVYYFWDDLVNLNYDHPEVQRHVVEASRYWIETFDVDGYRFDAVWGVVARNPDFVREWRLALKRVKPEAFLLAEDKATDGALFDERFDAAYDWSANPNYISQWAWQRTNQESTLFNTGLDQFKARDLRNALSNHGAGYHPDAVVFRYLENNDTPRFRAHHSVAQTKMASTLLFTLPGIPMLYYGQEIGSTNPFPSFPPSVPIAVYNAHGFLEHYRHLVALRNGFPALTGPTFEEVTVLPVVPAGQVFAFRRWTESGSESVAGHVVAAFNLGANPVSVTLELPAEAMGLDPETTYYATDLFTGEAVSGTAAELASFAVDLPGHSGFVWAVADSVVAPPVSAGPPAEPVAALAVEPNYPNPFSTRTTIPFTLPEAGPVRLRLFDVLGREVAVLVDGERPAGPQSVVLDGSGLAAGVYFVRIEASVGTAPRTATRTVLRVR